MKKPQLKPAESTKFFLIAVFIFVAVFLSQLPPPKDVKQKSFLGQAGLPRGVRNNNPGNLKYSPANAWLGKIPLTQKSDLTFEEFSEWRYGVRALLVLLKKYIFRHGTIEEIIHNYAPSTENETERYIKAVVKETGIPRNQALTSTSATLQKLAIAITRQEVGNGFEITTEDFLNAYKII